MRPSMMRSMGPPLEFILSEAIYAVLILVLCLIIYFRTKELYDLSKHKGLYYFRNIFLFFSVSYVLRALLTMVFLSKDLFDIFLPKIYFQIMLLLVAYTSTLALVFLATTVAIKHLKDIKHYDIIVHVCTFIISVGVFLTRSPLVLIAAQIILIAITLTFVFMFGHEKVTKNKITYILLCLFWILSVFSAANKLVPFSLRMVLNIIASLLFISIFIRVHKRLQGGKKKR